MNVLICILIPRNNILQVLVQNTNGRKLCRGADVHLNTPLHIAAKFGHIAAAKVILVVNQYFGSIIKQSELSNDAPVVIPKY